MIQIDNLKQILLGFYQVIPKLSGALIVLILGIVISKLIRRIVKEFLKKIKIDTYADVINQSDFLSKSKFKIIPSAILSAVLYYFSLLIFLIATTDILGMEALSKLISDIINWIPNMVTAMVILFGGFIVADLVKKALDKTCKSIGIPSPGLITNSVFYFILINVLISALSQAKVNTDFIAQNLSILIAGLCLAFALGYGLASKDVVANFLVSFYGKGKLTKGQKVTIEGVTGIISDIDKTSVIIDAGDRNVIIPLNKLVKEKIEIFK